ncbi:hypothetical protein HPB50_029298 [Hyalomma asiaticum]|nr:hypothetical protein HPB50_029298 [Hyalomma asiaticum]
MAPSRGRHETWERRNYNGYPSANSRQVPRSGHCAPGRRDVRVGFARRQQLRVSGFYTKCGRLGKRISSFDSIMSGPKNDSPDSVKQLEPQLGVLRRFPPRRATPKMTSWQRLAAAVSHSVSSIVLVRRQCNLLTKLWSASCMRSSK